MECLRLIGKIWLRLTLTSGLYEELLERKMIGKYLLGPYYRFEDGEKKLFKYKDSVEQFLALVDCLRVNETYSHTSCAGTFQFKLF